MFAIRSSLATVSLEGFLTKMEEPRYALDCGLLDYRLSKLVLGRNHLIYHSRSSILNYILLDLIKCWVRTTNGERVLCSTLQFGDVVHLETYNRYICDLFIAPNTCNRKTEVFFSFVWKILKNWNFKMFYAPLLCCSSHIFVISPSKPVATRLTLFLKRHLLTGSIGYAKDNKHEGSWPAVIVVDTNRLRDLFQNGYTMKMDLIIILECHDAMHVQSVIKLVDYVKKTEHKSRPVLHCFTSCIVSDACEPREMRQHVEVLEEFYDCKLLTSCDQFDTERKFSRPIQLIKAYEKQEKLSEPCMNALQVLNIAEDLCTNFSFHFNSRFSQIFQISSESFVKNAFSKIQQQMEELGEYGASIAELAAFRDLVRLYTFVLSSPGHNSKHMLSHLVCSLAKFRKILEDDMFRVQLCERGERFSSKKVQLLLDLLKDLPESRRALIIVGDLNTASTLTLILQKIAAQGKKHFHRKPELMINCPCTPNSEVWDDVLSWERNMEVYSRFVAGETNTVVLSGELQGLDLPCCDSVVVMDNIRKFSHFLHVKNLVKSETGQLIFLTENTSLTLYEEELKNLQEMEFELKKILTEDFEKGVMFPTNAEGFKTASGIVIKPNDLVLIVLRYCKSLSCDKFTPPWPVWKMKKYSLEPTLYRAYLYLPRVSPINKIKSNKMSSWPAAQQNAALRAFQGLYKMKEITDDMLLSWQTSIDADFPERIQVDSMQDRLNLKDHSYLELKQEFSKLGIIFEPQEALTCAEDEDIVCDTIYPLCLTAAQPKPDVEAFLHTLKIRPVSGPPPRGDNRKTVLYDLLCNESTFAILSSKPLPKVCEFPVFLFGHELSVEVEGNVHKLKLDRNELLRLRSFHCGLFMNVLPIVQNFMQFDVSNTYNSYLMAPLTSDGAIDWDVVDNNFSVPEARELTHEEKVNLVCTRETHERTMVKPWYRHLMGDQVYLVSTVCTDMSADSCFPTEEFDSFLDYYSDKYKIILERPELPLLEVYIIHTKVNGLLPRARSHKMRREEKMEDFREHMVPELCMSLQFPAALWLKLSSLPSVLHRLNRLLVVEEFSRIILLEAGVGSLENNSHRLHIDIMCVKDGLQSAKVPPSTVKRGLAIGNVKLEDRKRKTRLNKAWKEIQEPVDIHRFMESLNFVEIRYFDEFLIKSLSYCDPDPDFCQNMSSSPENEDFGTDSDFFLSESPENVSLSSPKKDEILPNSIDLLKPYGENNGPQLYELLEVFTSSTSNDGVNMDRSQVLGNAFLKLTISVYAYQYCMNSSSSRNSAYLHQLHTTFMSKSNLVKCSVQRKLCNRIKVLDFTPGEWIPPSFTTPPMLKQVLKEEEISSNVLQQIQLTETEQLTGIIDEQSQDEILDVLSNYVSRSTARRDEAYIDHNCVPSQTAANCVEALVGTYFKNCGWQGTLKVIGWLKLLPSQKLEGLLDCGKAQDCVSISSQSMELPLSLDSLQLHFNYSFNDKTLLVQALTHESFVHPLFQGNMNPLAFLGSSILDFLITCYIFEHFKELSPSQMWRIREIMSNKSSLAFFAVRHNIHKYLLFNSSSLLNAVDRFVNCQKGCQQTMDDEVQLLLEEHECESALQVEVPDALAKVIQSLVGAVYLDCGKNLSTTWDTFRSIFLPELGMWRQDVPLSVIELLKDLSPAAHQVIFTSKTKENGRVEVTCKILMDNTREKVFVACGYDETKTKTHAAKLALRNLLGTTNYSY